MSAPTAWQIEQAMSALMSGRAALLANDPDLAAIAWDEAALSEALKPETDDVCALLHRILRASVQARAMADAADQLIDDMTARRDRYKRRAETMRGTVFSAMDALGILKIELPDITASIAKGKPAAIITDEAALPDEYWRTTRAVNKAAINDAIKNGVVIPGVKISNAIPSLHVRTK
jgi:hypothetical protein